MVLFGCVINFLIFTKKQDNMTHQKESVTVSVITLNLVCVLTDLAENVGINIYVRLNLMWF